MSKRNIIIIGSTILILIVALVFLILKSTHSSQTVGQVTVDKSNKKIVIKEVKNPVWDIQNLSSVIGKAYHINQIKKDDDPVHVIFSYNPNDVPAGISESSLRLYKWHNEKEDNKYWAPVPSVVDTVNKIVKADLDSFSILAIRAPLLYYLSPGEVAMINAELQNLTKNMPENTCGVFIIVEEELLEWQEGELIDSFLRPYNEREEAKDCIKNPQASFPLVSYSILKNQQKQWNQTYGRDLSYTLNAVLEWQTDPEKSAIVKGIVKDQNNEALPNVSITATKQKYSAGTGQTVSGEDGSYQLELNSGQYLILADPSAIPVSNQNTGSDDMFSDPNFGNTEAGETSSRHCSPTSFVENFYEFGVLPDDLPTDAYPQPFHHGPWTRDIVLQCAKYYINQQVELVIDRSVYGAILSGIERQTITGQLVEPMKGGFGWEGKWKIDHKIQTKTAQSGTMSITTGGIYGNIDLSGASHDGSDHYDFTFILPLGIQEGDSFSYSGTQVEGGLNLKTQVVNGKAVVYNSAVRNETALPDGSLEDVINWGTVQGTGKVVSINGKDGVIVELHSLMSKERPQVEIKLKK